MEGNAKGRESWTGRGKSANIPNALAAAAAAAAVRRFLFTWAGNAQLRPAQTRTAQQSSAPLSTESGTENGTEQIKTKANRPSEEHCRASLPVRLFSRQYLYYEHKVHIGALGSLSGS
jgi:hypothetical protein